MKIAFYTDGADYGGAERMLALLIQGMNRQLWDPILLHHPKANIAPLLAKAYELNIPTYALPWFNYKSKIKTVHRFAQIIRELKPVVFHAHLPWPLACRYGLWAAAFARVPAIVATQHLYHKIQSRYLHPTKVQFTASLVHRYIAVSKHIATQMHESFIWVPPNKIQVIYNGIATDEFLQSRGKRSIPSGVPNKRRPTVLTVARLAEQKGLQYLIKAAAHIPEAIFLIAGDGPDRCKLEHQANLLGIGDRIIFLGRRDDVADLLFYCDLFVLPSLYEGLPVSILEAMAAQKPVVASAIGGVSEAVVDGKTGILVPPGNSSALAIAIKSLICNQRLAENLSANGKTRVEKYFTIHAMVSKTTELYEELLKSKNVIR